METKQKKILVFTVASFNNEGVGSGTWTTLLKGYDKNNIASVFIRDEVPNSSVCGRYFSISENKVFKSILRRGMQTGTEVYPTGDVACNSTDLQEHNARYSKMKKKRRYSMLLARELVWKLGKWHTKELDAFLDDFKPDVILHSMEGYIHLNRIVLHAIKRTGAKAVGYIWDDNFTYKQSNRIGYKVYRYFQRRSLKKLAAKTKSFFAISDKTKAEADAFFNVDCHLLTKPLNCTPVVKYNEIHFPIRLLYTGNLYIGRDQSLLKVVKAIEKFPPNVFCVDVYTHTELSDDVKKQLNDTICHIHAPVPQSEVLELQKAADALLFLEDIDGPDAHVARLSFSTKTTDYLSSGKCIVAVGNSDTAPMQYFIQHNAALVAESEKEIYDVLCRIYDAKDVLVDYAQNAAEVGIKNHNKEKIQSIFDEVLDRL